MENNLSVKKNETNRWFGQYKGIAFEINNFNINGIESLGVSDHDNWTYYLKINLNRVDDKTSENLWIKGNSDSKGRVSYNYYNVDQINDMYFHGGCTYYSKIAGFDGEDEIVKIGCDFNHLWDEGQSYDYDYVLSEVKNSINSFLLTAQIKHWCNGNGKIYDLSEGKLIKGTFYSAEYWGDKEVYINA